MLKSVYYILSSIYQQGFLCLFTIRLAPLGRMAGRKTGFIFWCAASLRGVLCPLIIKYAPVTNFQVVSRS